MIYEVNVISDLPTYLPFLLLSLFLASLSPSGIVFLTSKALLSWCSSLGSQLPRSEMFLFMLIPEGSLHWAQDYMLSVMACRPIKVIIPVHPDSACAAEMSAVRVTGSPSCFGKTAPSCPHSLGTTSGEEAAWPTVMPLSRVRPHSPAGLRRGIEKDPTSSPVQAALELRRAWRTSPCLCRCLIAALPLGHPAT